MNTRSLYCISFARGAFWFLLAAALAGCDSSSQPEVASSPNPTQSPIHIASPTSIDEAKKFLLGVWTYTGQSATQSLLGPNDMHYWLRIEFKADNTLTFSDPPPVADNWREPRAYKYQITTGKFSDTGARYFAAEWSGELRDQSFKECQTFQAIITDGKLILMRQYNLDKTNHWQIELTRGDKNPFSQ